MIIVKWITRKINKKLLRGRRIKSPLLEIAEKKLELEKRKNEITGLVLGSSHGAYAFDPGMAPEGYFNHCSTSQDLYYSYCLFVYSLNVLPHCKMIILFYSVFSPGYEVQCTSEKHIAAYYNVLYGIPPKYEPDSELLEQKLLCKRGLKAYTVNCRDTWGFNHLGDYFPADYPVTDRCKAHLRENQRSNNQFDYFRKLCREAIERGIHIYIVIPPARGDYRAGLPSKDELFFKLIATAKEQQIKILDFFDSSIFHADDFGDFDHLTPDGAQKLTKEIFQLLAM